MQDLFKQVHDKVLPYFLILILFATSSFAFNDFLDLQGLLYNNTDGSKVNDTIAFNITLVNRSDGSAVYSEVKNITVSQAVFNYIIGSVNPLSNFLFRSDLQYRIKIGNDNLSTQNFTKTPYSFYSDIANNSDYLNGASLQSILNINTTTNIISLVGPHANATLNTTDEIRRAINNTIGIYNLTIDCSNINGTDDFCVDTDTNTYNSTAEIIAAGFVQGPHTNVSDADILAVAGPHTNVSDADILAVAGPHTNATLNTTDDIRRAINNTIGIYNLTIDCSDINGTDDFCTDTSGSFGPYTSANFTLDLSQANATINASIDARVIQSFIVNLGLVINAYNNVLNITGLGFVLNAYNSPGNITDAIGPHTNVSDADILAVAGPHTNATLNTTDEIRRAINNTIGIYNLTIDCSDINGTDDFCADNTGSGSANCSVSGSCAPTGVAYMNYENTGNFNITGNLTVDHIYGLGGNLGVGISDDGSDVTLHAEVGGTNLFTMATDQAFFSLTANPGPANGYLLASITETQGADTEINFYEGGTGHNRFWDSGSGRVGGPAGYLCSALTDMVDCDTPNTGADWVVQDEGWYGGALFVVNGSINLTDAGNIRFNGSLYGTVGYGNLTGVPDFYTGTQVNTSCDLRDDWNSTDDIRRAINNTIGIYNLTIDCSNINGTDDFCVDTDTDTYNSTVDILNAGFVLNAYSTAQNITTAIGPHTNLTEDDVEAYIFDDDNTANLNISAYNITNVDCIKFISGGQICTA